jgi:hypothetical protein
MKPIDYFLSGAIVMGFWVIGLFFFKFWRDSRDRLFAYFCLAFWILAAERIGVVYIGTAQDETGPVVYLARVVAFFLIAWGILEKNRPWRKT